MQIPAEAAAAVIRFQTEGRTGSVTLHFRDGHLASWESREVGKPGRSPVELKNR